MGDSVENGLLTEAERNALDDSLMDSGCHGFQGDHPDLYATAERIIRERMAQAWGEGNKTVPDYHNPYVLSPGEQHG